MAKIVHLPDGQTVSFPDNVTPEQMRSALQNFSPQGAQEANQVSQATRGPSMKEQVFKSLESGLPLAGSLAGGTLGGMAGLATGPAAPVAAPAASIAGLAGGAALGQSAVEALRPYMTGETPTFAEAMGRSIEAGALFAMFEGGGRVLGRGAQAVGQRLRNVILPKRIPPEILRAHETLVRQGSSLTPAQLTGEEATILDIAENISQNAFFGQRIFAQRFKGQKDALAALSDEILTGLEGKLSPEDIGTLVRTEITNRSDLTREVASSLYDRVFMQAPNALAPVDNLMSAAGSAPPKVLRRLEALLNKPLSESGTEVAVRGQTFSDGSPVGVMSALTGKSREQFMPLVDAHRLRSRLLEIARRDVTGAQQMDVEIVGLAKQLASKLSDTLLNTDRVVGLPDDVQELYKTASVLTSGAAEAFQNEFISKMTQRLLQQPGEIGRLVLVPDSAQALAKWKRAVGPEVWQQVQARAGAKLIRDASSGSAEGGMGQINGQELLDEINNLGRETVESLFSQETKTITQKGTQPLRSAEGKPATTTRRVSREKTSPVFDSLTELGNALVQAKERAHGSGSMLIQFGQASAAVTIGSGVLGEPGTSTSELGLATAIILAPPMIGRMLTSPATMRFLTKGLEAGPGTPEWAKAAEEVANLSQPTFVAPAAAAATNAAQQPEAGQQQTPTPTQ